MCSQKCDTRPTRDDNKISKLKLMPNEAAQHAFLVAAVSHILNISTYYGASDHTNLKKD